MKLLGKPRNANLEFTLKPWTFYELGNGVIANSSNPQMFLEIQYMFYPDQMKGFT